MMKSKTTHITNGDVTTNVLRDKLCIKESIFTWRELLCEGKTCTNFGSEQFWKSRFEFLSSIYNISKREYISKTIKEFKNICNTKEQEEIILWFDSDLFCQINLVGLISWLKKNRKGVTISLVSLICEVDFSGKSSFYNLSKQQLNSLFNKRKVLSQDDIEYADYVWQIYCSNSPLKLQSVQKSSTFTHLKSALDLHIKRFPSVLNGLNIIEHQILKIVRDSEQINKPALIKKLLQDNSLYGFSDLQYSNMINELKLLFERKSQLILNSLGHKVVTNQFNYYPYIKNETVYYGGALKYKYLYNQFDGKLLKL